MGSIGITQNDAALADFEEMAAAYGVPLMLTDENKPCFITQGGWLFTYLPAQ